MPENEVTMTTSLQTSEVRIAQKGHIHVAEYGVLLPDDVATVLEELDADYAELGYADDSGVSVNPQVKLAEIQAWQSSASVAAAVDTTGVEVKFKAIQVNEPATALFFFGQAWEAPETTGDARLPVPVEPGLNFKTVIITWTDQEGDRYRLVLPRMHLSDSDAMVMKRKESMAFGVTLKAYAHVDEDFPDGVLAYLLSNNPDLGAVAAAS